MVQPVGRVSRVVEEKIGVEQVYEKLTLSGKIISQLFRVGEMAKGNGILKSVEYGLHAKNVDVSMNKKSTFRGFEFRSVTGNDSSVNSSTSGDWILGEYFERVQVRNESPVAGKASRRGIQSI
ncbi:hypothetical protein LWI28_011224 [Acer negundo]|uniref:Uncharacterized protein n=1 Tax=Acer negundo TaxID=4023 RepID=A0AAD5IZ54_ACENE|nr:hypothetical protein LWI28_011224 [Acer negundo]